MVVRVAAILVACCLPSMLSQKGNKARVPKPEELDAKYWLDNGKKTLKKILSSKNLENPAKNVIFFLGDGMGMATVTASRIYQGQLRGESGEENFMFFETFPNVALSKTYNLDKQVPDSAATSTAYLGGVKANYHTIGVTGRVKEKDCTASLNSSNHVFSVMKWAIDAGKSVGFVTTMRVTHATPAGLYAHVANREWETDSKLLPSDRNRCSDIALQLVHGETGKHAKVIFGGGKKNFFPISTGGSRFDGRNLTNEWINAKTKLKKKGVVVYTKKQLYSVDSANTDYIFGLFNDDHMTYELDRHKGSDGLKEPTIYEMTGKAIEFLRKDKNGYFLFVEGGKIDWAHHAGHVKRALTETVAFDDAVRTAVGITSMEDTLIVVTADHSHTMTINGYPERGQSILGTVKSEAEDRFPNLNYTTLMYTNGPGYRSELTTPKDTSNDDYVPLAAFPKKYETHGGEDVVIYAQGPMAHLFRGVVEQNYIPRAIAYIACYDKENNACLQPFRDTKKIGRTDSEEA